MQSIRFWLSSVILLLGISPLLAAESMPSTQAIPGHPALSDDLSISLGLFYPRITTSASLGPSGGGTGVAIDFENTFDLDERAVTPIAGLFWRVTDNWRLDIGYFDLSRDATRTLAADVIWGDQTFTAGTTVDSSFDFSDLRISAAYSFFKRRDKEVGIGLGLHVAGMKTSVQASGVGAEASDVTAPLPVINLYALFALTDEWAVNMRADWLSLTYGDYSGDVRNLEMNALYQPFRNVGFGLGVRSLVIDVDIDNPDWRGQARLAFQGPTAFMTVSF
jgi:hypothetical protein